jgi:hypothetical protein
MHGREFERGNKKSLLCQSRIREKARGVEIHRQPDRSTLLCAPLWGHLITTTILMRLMHNDALLTEVVQPYMNVLAAEREETKRF